MREVSMQIQNYYYTFDYLRAECEPWQATLFSLWGCWLFFVNTTGMWQPLAYGHKVEFAYSKYMGSFL